MRELFGDSEESEWTIGCYFFNRGCNQRLDVHKGGRL